MVDLRTALAAPALVALAVACGSDSHAGPNVLLITVDTLRADRLGCYGNARELTPSLDALAAEGVLFERAYSPAPWTMPAVASIHTGLYPRSHTVRRSASALPGEVATLAEALRTRGWATASITSNRLLKERLGFAQGFERYDTEEARGHEWISTPGVTARAVEALEQLSAGESPWFLSVLYFDPHYDWQSHGQGLAAATAGRLDGDETIAELRAMAAEDPGLTDEEVGYLRDLYDEEVRFTDAGIGRLLGRLDELGLADDTLVVLTADHGEEFLEHGWLGHTRFLYEGMVRVPLVLRDPRDVRRPPRRVATPVSTVSIMATVLERAGVDPLPLALQAPSLVPWLEGRQGPTGPVFSEVDFVPANERLAVKEAHLEAVVDGEIKVIRDTSSGALEVYRPADDPLERRDLGPEGAQAQVEALAAWREATAARALTAREATYSQEEIDALRALGYVDGGDH